MKRLRLVFGLALIPLCIVIGSFIRIGDGSGVIVGLVLGIVLSYFFLTYGPGSGKKSPLPTSSYLNQHHQVNGGANQQTIENESVRAREAALEIELHMQNQPRY